MPSRYGTRKPNRAPGFDYRSPGPYFITICVQNRQCLFGIVADNIVRLNDAGMMIAEAWDTIARQFQNTQFEDSVIMPNHMHALLTLPAVDDHGVDLGTIVQAFKRLTTNRYVAGVKENGWPRFEGSCGNGASTIISSATSEIWTGFGNTSHRIRLGGRRIGCMRRHRCGFAA